VPSFVIPSQYSVWSHFFLLCNHGVRLNVGESMSP
jgi:hypothetical protein